MIITYNSVVMPSIAKVKSYNITLMPPIERQTVKIHGRAGVFNLSREYGERVINVQFIITSDTETEYRANLRTLASWLYTDAPVSFKIDSDPDYYYMAMVDQETGIEELVDEAGVIGVTFVCSQPFSIKTSQQSYALSQNSTTVVTNSGDVASYPIVQATFAYPATFVEIENGTTLEAIRIGSAVRYGEVEPFDMFTNIVNDPMTNLGTWSHLTNGTQLNPSSSTDGIVTTQMELRTTTIAGSSQTGFGLGTGSTWGSGTGDQWIGAGAEYTLASDYADFSVEFDVQMNNQYLYSSPKMEMYLYGTSGEEICKLNYTDSSYGQVNPQLWLRFNDDNPYETTIDDDQYVGFTGTSAGADVSKNRDERYYYNRTGLIKIKFARRLKNWRVHIAVIDPSSGGFNKVLRSDTFEYEDSENLLNYENLKKVRITVARVNSTTIPTDLIFHSVRINQENIASYDPATKLPWLFNTGDVLRIDMSTAQIWLNGQEFYSYFDPTSNFWKLRKGTNNIGLYSNYHSSGNPAISACTMYVNERYL